MKVSTHLAVGLVMVSIISSAQAGSRWPQFRGPNGQGVAESEKPPVSFGPTTNLLWKTALPSGHSSPSIWEERIFVTAFDKETKKLETICLDRKTGKVLWRRSAPAERIEKVHEIGSPANSTPVTDGKNVYVYFGSYGLIAYDFEGAVVWQKPLPMAKIMMDFGTGTSPILTGDRLILDMHLDQESHLLAIRCKDGETLWKAPKPLFNGGWSTPIVWREGDGDVVGILNAGRFTAHDLKSGAERWWIAGLPNQICATPAVSDGLLFLTGTGVLGERENISLPPSFDEVLAKYDANKDGKISTAELPESLLFADRKGSGAGNMPLRQALLFGSEEKVKTFDRAEWEKMSEQTAQFVQGDFMKTSALAVRIGGKQDVTATHVAWTEAKGVPEVPSPLLYRNRLYYVKNGGVLTCRDAKSGKTLFEERLDAPGGYYASPVVADGKIYTASDRGVVTVLQAADKFHVLARNDLKESIMATPAIVDNKLYVRTSKQLYAFGR
jgi:outer membrane protein assembly factor BamB